MISLAQQCVCLTRTLNMSTDIIFFLANILLLSLVFWTVILIVKRRKIYQLSWRLPGPIALPILGNAFTFFCKNEDIFDAAVDLVSNYPSPLRFWFGPKFTLIFSEAPHAAKIMTSTNFINKDSIYKFIQEFDGEGLISGSGPKWKRDRKLLAPLFLKKDTEQYFSSILHHVKILLEKVESHQQFTFNVEHFLHRCCADFVNETLFGVKTDAQNGKMDEFLDKIDRMYALVHARIVKVWLQVEWMFKLTHYWREQEEGKKLIHGTITKMIEEVKKNHRSHINPFPFEPLLHKMLDIKHIHPEFANDMEFLHHVVTFYSASEDTITTISAFVLLLLGMYPEVQNKVVNEIYEILDNNNRKDLELDDIPKFTYLNMCLQEVLRLFPIAPFIMRVSQEDFIFSDSITIPKGCSVVVAIHNIHRDPKIWEKPNDFYPEHFLPEAVKSRHPYAFLPFSAGPRGCLGKSYAAIALRIVLVTFLRRYEVEADGQLKDVKLKTDISVRAKNGYPIRIKLRESA